MESLAPHERKFLEKLELPNNAQIYDVGANVGQFAVACMELWPEAYVTCFEPNEAAFLELVKNTRPWADSLSLRECALSSQQEQVLLHYGGPGTPDQSASLFHRWLPGVGHLHQCSRTMIAHSLIEFLAAPVDLLKLDVEGSELRVLEGAGRELRPERIKGIYFEFNSCALDARVFFRDFWRLLTSRGYGLWEIDSNGDRSPIVEYEPELEDFAAHREFFADADSR